MPAWVPFLEKFQITRESMPDIPPVPPVPPRAPTNPSDAGPARPDSAPKQADPNSKVVDVNTATLEELVEVLGIETIGAKRIIQQRDVVGGFKSVEQIGELLGLKPHHVEKLRQLATFTPLTSQAKGGRVID
ncbi:Helix-hairpin-helix motif protein [compost metagenome]